MHQRPEEPSPERVMETIRRRCEEIKRRELRKALSRLEADGELAESERARIEEMATALVDDLLAVPNSALRSKSEHDAETLRRAIQLFEPEE